MIHTQGSLVRENQVNGIFHCLCCAPRCSGEVEDAVTISGAGWDPVAAPIVHRMVLPVNLLRLPRSTPFDCFEVWRICSWTVNHESRYGHGAVIWHSPRSVALVTEPPNVKRLSFRSAARDLNVQWQNRGSLRSQPGKCR